MTLRSLSLLFAVLLTAAAAIAQRPLTGRVVDVVDGRTVIIQLESGRLTGVLQYIETPEPEQPLAQIVKEHLAKLVLGQLVEFAPKAINSSRTTGTLYFNGRNIAQQLVRDGAAWHVPPARTGQADAEARIFAVMQDQAKTERRGIWADTSVKPAWEFRAEKAENVQRRKIDEWNVYLEKASQPSSTLRGKRPTDLERQQANAKVSIWPDINGEDAGAENRGLLAAYDADKQEGYTASHAVKVTFNGTAGQRYPQTFDFRAVYVYRGDPGNMTDNAFIFGFLTGSPDARFAVNNELSIIADRETFNIGPAKRLVRPGDGVVQELMLYRIEPHVMKKLVSAKTVTARLGRYFGTMQPVQEPLRQLLAVTD